MYEYPEFELDGLKLVQTCFACPEQYDAFLEEEQIGYLRLRHGCFTVQYTPTMEYVLEARPEGDGIFAYDERDRYLRTAVHLLKSRHLMG